jgi:hypothetical protein
LPGYGRPGSPEGGLALLRKAQRDGRGHTSVFSIPRSYAHQLLTDVGPVEKARVLN